jgi:hypothetical protein
MDEVEHGSGASPSSNDERRFDFGEPYLEIRHECAVLPDESMRGGECSSLLEPLVRSSELATSCVGILISWDSGGRYAFEALMRTAVEHDLLLDVPREA